MELWVATAEIDPLLEAKELGLLDGVLIRRNEATFLTECLRVHPGSVAVEIAHPTAHEIVEEAKVLVGISDRIVVQLPATKEGLKAIHRMAHFSIPTIVTGISNLAEALVAAKSGAAYIQLAPVAPVDEIASMLLAYQFATEIMLEAHDLAAFITSLSHAPFSVMCAPHLLGKVIQKKRGSPTGVRS